MEELKKEINDHATFLKEQKKLKTAMSEKCFTDIEFQKQYENFNPKDSFLGSVNSRNSDVLKLRKCETEKLLPS